jgi:hypothetical protein
MYSSPGRVSFMALPGLFVRFFDIASIALDFGWRSALALRVTALF